MMKFDEPIPRPARYSVRGGGEQHKKTEKIYSLIPPAQNPNSPAALKPQPLTQSPQSPAENRRAKVKDIVASLKTTTTTATTLIYRLEEKQLIIYQRHKGAVLTPEGEKLAQENLRYLRDLYNLITMAGIPETTAKTDAEILNRELSRDSLTALLGCIRKNPD